MIKYQNLSKKLLRDCFNKQIKLLIAESCTGGLLSANVTSVSGSSSIFTHGLICYSNEAKIKYLDVSEKTIRSYGAVSAETVKEMLIGLSHQAKSKSLAIAISGVAGPKRSENKPVGLVYIGAKVTSDDSEAINEFNFGNIDRNIIQQRSVHEALIMALDLIKKN